SPTHSFVNYSSNDTASTQPYTLTLHDALPICYSHGQQVIQRAVPRERLGEGRGEAVPLPAGEQQAQHAGEQHQPAGGGPVHPGQDRKSTRLNSSHVKISYAVFCLKKKKKESKT